MGTTLFTISPTWAKAADGPTSVLIPAFHGFYFAITAGGVPDLDPKVCPSYRAGEDLTLELVTGESLYVVSPGATFATTVTKDA